MNAPALLALFSQLRILLGINQYIYAGDAVMTLLKLSDSHFWIHVSCCSFHSVHILIESGELELRVRLVLILQLFWVEGS